MHAANILPGELHSRRSCLHFSANQLYWQQMHKIGRSMPNLSSREIFTADSKSEIPYVRKIRTALDSKSLEIAGSDRKITCVFFCLSNSVLYFFYNSVHL
jgi:hypothetical protein